MLVHGWVITNVYTLAEWISNLLLKIMDLEASLDLHIHFPTLFHDSAVIVITFS